MRVWRNGLKWCGGPCGRNLPREAYYTHNSRGYVISQSWCKNCSRVNTVTRWRTLYRTVKAFREKEKAKSRRLYRKYAEKRKARARERYQELKRARAAAGASYVPVLPSAGAEFQARIKAAIKAAEPRGRPRKGAEVGGPARTSGNYAPAIVEAVFERTGRASSPGL